MSISDHTINRQYEYRITNIVRKVVETITEKYRPTTGDELLKQVKGE